MKISFLFLLTTLSTHAFADYSRSCLLDFLSSMSEEKAKTYCSNVASNCYENFRGKLTNKEARNTCFNVSSSCYKDFSRFNYPSTAKDFCLNVDNRCYQFSIFDGADPMTSRNNCFDRI